MPAMFGGTPIGAMQYGGTPIAEAMIDGQIVYRSIIRVTPAAPTFHDGEPWVTLPTVEGVTYTVAGTPDWGASITITASAEDGYQLDGQVEWEHQYETTPPVMITGTSGLTSRNQFRQACVDYGTTHDTVETLPFRLNTSQSTDMNRLFQNCSALTAVPDIDTSQVTIMHAMFQNCSSLTDGNVRLIGRHPDVDTTGMLIGSGLTREPFYDQAGNPI